MRYLKRWSVLVWALILAAGMGISASAAEGDLNLHIHKYEVEDYDEYLSEYEANGTVQTIEGLKPLKNVRFRVQLVETSVVGSTDPGDYTPVAQGYDQTLPTDTNGNASFLVLDPGIYLVTELENEAVIKKSLPFLVSMPMTNPAGDGLLNDVHVYPKNELEKPEIGKEVEQGSAGYEDKVTWTIKVTIPKDIAAAEKYEIWDQLDEKLEFTNDAANIRIYWVNSASVQTDLTYATDYTAAYQNNKITVSFNTSQKANLGTILPDSVDKKLYIEIDTYVKDGVDLGEIDNQANLDFTNNVGKDYDPESEIPKTNVLGVRITKIETGSQNSTPVYLQGAKFKIYGQENGSMGANPLKKPGTTDDWEVTTDVNGKAVFDGLAYGTYYLVETQSPSGYNPILEPREVEVSDTTANLTTDWYADVTVENNKGFTLPITGDIGTTIFLFVGLILISLGAVVILRSRKNRSTNA